MFCSLLLVECQVEHEASESEQYTKNTICVYDSHHSKKRIMFHFNWRAIKWSSIWPDNFRVFPLKVADIIPMIALHCDCGYQGSHRNLLQLTIH